MKYTVMMSKSHVGCATRLCRVTGKEFDSGEILLDRRLKDTLEPKNLIGWGYSPEVQEKLDEGYIALVEIDFEKSTVGDNGMITPENAYRLGRIHYVKRHVLKEIVPSLEVKHMSWAESDFLDYLESLVQE